MDFTVLGILSSFVVAIAGVVIAIFTAKSSINKTELESLRATITELRATISSLQGENERLRKRLYDIECAADAKDKTIHEQATEIETLRDQVDELRAQIDEMSKRRRSKL